MEISVRSNAYEAALQLDTFVNDLKKKHGGIPIVDQIVRDTNLHTDALLRQLHNQLKASIQLPECLRIIGYLKRLAVYEDDRQLRIGFLQSRNEWLEGVLASISNTNVQSYLKEFIEVSRTHIFDIITQYRAIFSDEAQEDAGLLFSWVNQKVERFLTILTANLVSVTDGLGLSVLLEQSMYYGMSLGRIGLDFRPLLIPPFEQQISTVFAQLVVAATDRFVTSFANYKFKQTSSLGSLPVRTSQFTPPATLVDFLPLGQLLNGYLGALNELRHTAAASLAVQLSEVLKTALNRVVTTIINSRAELGLDEEEEKVLAKFLHALAYDLVPHVVSCFNALFDQGRPLLSADVFQKPLAPLLTRSSG